MSDIRIIEDHNSAAKDAYKRKMREKKTGDSTTPVRENMTADSIRPNKPNQASFHAMGQTAPLPVQKSQAEWLMRATVGGTQTSGKSSKTLENMLNNCCVLMNMKQFDQSSPGRNGENNFLRPQMGMKRNSSNSLIGESMSDKHRPLSYPETPDVNGGNKSPTSKHSGSEEIERHNQLYKKNRSSSQNKRQGSDRSSNADPIIHHKKADISSEIGYMKPPKSSEDKKNKGQLLTSIKDMIYGGPFKNFGRKKTVEKKEDLLFDCKCNKDKKVKKIAWDLNTGCMRSILWLRNKENPVATYEEAKEFYLRKAGERILPQNIREDIQKDVVRTFNGNEFMSQDSVKRRLEGLLEVVAVVYRDASYVQGMNFIAGALLFHCDQYLALGVIRVLFDHLEVKDMFLPSRQRAY
jgi:hypothetical protein